MPKSEREKPPRSSESVGRRQVLDLDSVSAVFTASSYLLINDSILLFYAVLQ